MLDLIGFLKRHLSERLARKRLLCATRADSLQGVYDALLTAGLPAGLPPSDDSWVLVIRGMAEELDSLREYVSQLKIVSHNRAVTIKELNAASKSAQKAIADALCLDPRVELEKAVDTLIYEHKHFRRATHNWAAKERREGRSCKGCRGCGAKVLSGENFCGGSKWIAPEIAFRRPARPPVLRNSPFVQEAGDLCGLCDTMDGHADDCPGVSGASRQAEQEERGEALNGR